MSTDIFPCASMRSAKIPRGSALPDGAPRPSGANERDTATGSERTAKASAPVAGKSAKAVRLSAEKIAIRKGAVSRLLRLSGAGRDAKLRAGHVRVRTVLSENERLTLTNSCLIV